MPAAISPEDTKVVRGVKFRRDPARDASFTVAQLPSELHDYADMSDVANRQRLHRHMHNEMQNLEIVAQSLADFPDEPWELRMEMARQCWDEARHCALCHRRLKEVGGRKGEFPVMNYEWGVVCLQDTLVARMALQNRTFEGGEMDLLRELSNIWRDHGDIETSELLDGMLADEVQHVRYANAWFKRIAKENPRVLLKLAEAVSYLSKVTAALMPEDDEVNAVGVPLKGWTHLEVFTNVEDRLLAGFTEREIEELRRQEKQGAGPAVAAATG